MVVSFFSFFALSVLASCLYIFCVSSTFQSQEAPRTQNLPTGDARICFIALVLCFDMGVNGLELMHLQFLPLKCWD